MQHVHSGKPQGCHVQNPTPIFPLKSAPCKPKKNQVGPSQPQLVQQEILSVPLFFFFSVPLLKPVRDLITSPLSVHQHSMVFTSSQVRVRDSLHSHSHHYYPCPFFPAKTLDNFDTQIEPLLLTTLPGYWRPHNEGPAAAAALSRVTHPLMRLRADSRQILSLRLSVLLLFQGFDGAGPAACNPLPRPIILADRNTASHPLSPYRPGPRVLSRGRSRWPLASSGATAVRDRRTNIYLRRDCQSGRCHRTLWAERGQELWTRSGPRHPCPGVGIR